MGRHVMNTKSFPRAQKGYLLIASLVGTLILAIAMAGVFKYLAGKQARQQIDGYGQQFAQLAVGLRGFVADLQNGAITLPANPIVLSGVDWIKPATCPGVGPHPILLPAGKEYVPCSFTGGPLANLYRSRISSTPSGGTAQIEVRTYFIVPEARSGVYGQAVFASKLAEASLAQQAIPASGLFYNVFANTAIMATAPVDANLTTVANRGRVLMVVSNAPANDIWLRVDGTNQMLANLNFGGNSAYNAQDAHFDGTVQIDNGLSVTSGTAQINDGVITSDVKVQTADAAGGYMASQALYRMQVYSGGSGVLGWNVPKPDCTLANTGGGNSHPVIFAALQNVGTAADVNADAINKAGVRVTDVGGFWRVKPVLGGIRFDLDTEPVAGGVRVILRKAETVPTSTSTPSVIVMTKCA